MFTELIDLQEQVQLLEDEFADLVTEFVDYLVKNGTSIYDVKKYIRFIPRYVGASITPLWCKLKPEVEQIAEIDEFVEMLSLNLWNFLDYEMLKYLIMKCKIPHLSQEIESYVKKIKDFKRTTLVVPFIKCWKGRHQMDDIPDSVVELTIKFDIKEDITKFTLSRLEVLRDCIVNKCVPLLSHFASAMYYYKFSEGSICVSWLFPERFSLVLKNRIQDMSLILEKYHTLWVKINEEFIYLQSTTKLCKL